MIHSSLPQTMTKETLADYIRSNRVETKNHVEKFLLTEEEKFDLAMKSSIASRAIKRLEDLKKYVTDLIKKGTPMDLWIDQKRDHAPVDIVIPPTVGIDTLEANREYADNQIEKGYREEITAIYFIPWPEQEKMIGVDIEGKEWSNYTRAMTKDEIKQHGKPILRATEEIKEIMESQGLEIEKVDGKEVKLRKKSAQDKQPPLSEDEQKELESGESDDLNL